MLIFKEPVKLKCFSNNIKLNNSFHNKILANYDFMTVNIKKEELLYLLMGIQEIEESTAMTMLIDNISITNKNDIMINYINQTINRILNLNSDYISYQDRIFISCALRNMGIYNVSQFIKNIVNSMSILELKDRLLNQYEKKLSEKTVINYNSEKESIIDISINENKDDKAEYSNKKNYLFKYILKRIDYINSNKSVYKFAKSYGMGNTYMSHNQLVLAEQYNNAKKVDLITKRYDFYGYDMRSDESSVNPYEMVNYIDIIKGSTVNSIMTDIVQTALFHIIKLVKINIIEENYHNKPVWTDTGDRICNTIGNSLERFKIYHTTGKLNNINFTDMVLNSISEKEENSISINLLRYLNREVYEDIAEEFEKEYLKESSVTNIDNENIAEEQIINILNNVINKCIIKNESKWNESNITNNSKNYVESDIRSTSINKLQMVLRNISEKEENVWNIKLLSYIDRELYEGIAEEFVKEYLKENSVTNMDNENITEEQIINILNTVINKCIVENESKWHESDIIKNSNNYIDNDIRSSSVNQLEMVLNNENKVSSFFNSIINNKTQNNIINTNIMLSGTKQADIVYKVENKEYEDNTFSGNKSNSTTYVRNIKENNNNTENTDLKNKILNYSENVEQRIITNKRDVELQSVVKENIQREIKSITEQVYKRIEKKLQNEKKRRGI